MENINIILANGDSIPVAAYDIPCNFVVVGTRDELDAVWDELTPENCASVAIEAGGSTVLRVANAKVDSVQFIRNPDSTFTGHFNLSGEVSGDSEDSAYSAAAAILMGGEQDEENVVARATELRETIEELAQGLSDDRALENTELYPVWRPGMVFTKAGGVWVIDGRATDYPDDKPMKILHFGTLYYFLQPHTTQADWPPDAAVSLFSPVLPGQEGNNDTEWKQPIGDINPYRYGDRVTHNGRWWVSIFNGDNVWEPGAYGWADDGPAEQQGG